MNLSVSGLRTHMRRVLDSIRQRPWAAQFLILLLGLLILLLAAINLPSPSPMLVLRADTESVDIEVVNPELATIYLPRAFDEASGACVEDFVIEPDIGTKIIYARVGNGELTVSVSGGARRRGEKTGLLAPVDAFRAMVMFGDVECGTEFGTVRLPVNGILDIGSEAVGGASVQTPMFLGGEIDVLNRSASRVLGFIPLNWGPFSPDILYHAGHVSLPAGSRLLNATSLDERRARWFGFADAKMGMGGDALSLYASSNAYQVDIFAAAPFRPIARNRSFSAPVSAKPDKVSLTLGARLVGDPNLRWILGLVTVLSIVLGAISYATESFLNKRSESSPNGMRFVAKNIAPASHASPKRWQGKGLKELRGRIRKH